MGKTVQRRGIRIFRAADAPELGATDIVSPSDSSIQEAERAKARAAIGGQAGSISRVLVRDADGFSLLYFWFKPNFPLPRHSHNSDCLYYVISGSAILGSQTLRAGDSFFVPSDAPYRYSAGPEGVEALEIRHGVQHFDVKLKESNPARWQEISNIVEANRETWSTSAISPTLLANSATGEGETRA